MGTSAAASDAELLKNRFSGLDLSGLLAFRQAVVTGFNAWRSPRVDVLTAPTAHHLVMSTSAEKTR